MVTITINHNDDEIIIQKDKYNITFRVKGSTMEYRRFLEEFLNILDPIENVLLEEINEDNCRTVDEW